MMVFFQLKFNFNFLIILKIVVRNYLARRTRRKGWDIFSNLVFFYLMKLLIFHHLHQVFHLLIYTSYWLKNFLPLIYLFHFLWRSGTFSKIFKLIFYLIIMIYIF